MWILASRGRPASLERFVKAYILTKATSKVYVRVDECDSALEEYKTIELPETFEFIVGPRARLGNAMREMFNRYPNEDFYGLLADDVVPRTDYWDKMLIEAAGTKCISGANDLTKKPKNLCHPCVGGDLVRAAGFFATPKCIHYCLELPWKFLTKKDKRFLKYLPNVIVENLHLDFGKAVLDNTYKESFSVRDNDHDLYDQWHKENFESFYKKLIKVL